MPHRISRFGWLPDLPDHRDLRYEARPATIARLPARIDLTQQCPPVYDQGELGSCTANAIAGAFEFEQDRQSAKSDFMPSRLFIYYNERVIEHTINSDSGAMIRDGMKCVNQQGVCPETLWPYDPGAFTQKPPDACYKNALSHQVVSYHRVPRHVDQMKGCLSEGYPFVLGFTVYEAFESPEVAKTGVLNLPSSSERQIGGHAVMAVGYDDAQNRFLVRNSWGAAWGRGGYFTMPYEYLMNENLSDDFWTIRLVEMERGTR